MAELRILLIFTWVRFGCCLDCIFPQSWQGNWFSGNIGEVRITPHSFTSKGKCIDSSSQYYLMENSDIGCFTCLLIVKRHLNILQYQESFCGGKDSLESTCRNVNTNMWHTLIKESNITAPCPFEHAYHFGYNNDTGGYCRSPASKAQPCAHMSHYKIQFEECPAHVAAFTYKREVDLRCIGTWSKDGNLYMVGKLQSLAFKTKLLQYRCFIYHQVGTLMYMAMSIDASCLGLTDSTSGSVTMEMNKDKFGWPDSSCEFPKWVNHDTWRNLDGSQLYSFNKKVTVMYMSTRSSFNSTASIIKAFRCVKTTYDSSKEVTILAFTSRKCTSEYQCLKLIKKRDGVIEFHEGLGYSYNPRNCSNEKLFHDALNKFLISKDTSPQKCPLVGRHLIRTGIKSCTSYFRIGCNGSSVIDIINTCSLKSGPGLQLYCLKSWREPQLKQRYIIARQAEAHDGPANCFVIKRFHDGTAQFSIDAECNINTSYILKDTNKYTLDSKAIKCDIPSSIPKDISVGNHYNNVVEQEDNKGQVNVNNAWETPNDSPKENKYDLEDKRQPRGYRTPTRNISNCASNVNNTLASISAVFIFYLCVT